jgi:hypothetical protein
MMFLAKLQNNYRVLKQINVDSRLYLEVIRTNQVLSVMLDAIGRDEIPPE